MLWTGMPTTQCALSIFSVAPFELRGLAGSISYLYLGVNPLRCAFGKIPHENCCRNLNFYYLRVSSVEDFRFLNTQVEQGVGHFPLEMIVTLFKFLNGNDPS